MRALRTTALLFLVAAALLGGATCAQALEPPDPGEIARLKSTGELAARLERVEALGNHKFEPFLVQQAARRLEVLKRKALGQPLGDLAQPLTPPVAWRGMPTSGTVRILALLIEFSDTPAVNSRDTIDDALFGDGLAVNEPYESLSDYYDRASYGQLTITGDTLGWYNTGAPRADIPQTVAGREALIKEVLNHYDGLGQDFSQYDNDGNGVIDFIVIFWAGEDNGWGNFWWGYQTGFNDDTYTLDGKTLGRYCWQWESRPVGTAFTPRVVIHETGHGLGLPDYYDYDGDLGPDGGVGNLDMMDANIMDHNAFSKWMLDWLEPAFVASGSQNLTLSATGLYSAAYPQAVMIWPGASSDGLFSEYFLAQVRTPVNNDNTSPLPTSGLMIWHVDATLNAGGTNFLYNNSYTAHKLLRLMEADGLEEIEIGDGNGDAGDFYTAGQSFGPATTPDSNTYGGADSEVSITNLTGPSGNNMTMTCQAGEDAAPVTLNEALDNAELFFIPGGNAEWAGQIILSHDGEDAAQSGVITDDQSTWLVSGVTGPGQLSFWWKVSSESGFDFMRFLVDDEEAVSAISGAVDWTQVSVDIASGAHLLYWSYAKDDSLSGGSDQAWLDQVAYTACTFALDPDSLSAFAKEGGTSTVAVDCNMASCPWTATSGADWITVTSGATGTGDGSVGLSVAANAGLDRSATVTIGGHDITVNQAGPTYSITPQSQSFGIQGGTGTVQVVED